MEIRTIPEIPFIGSGSDGAQKLYTLEDVRRKAVTAAAKQHGKVLGYTESEFWTKTMPEHLASLLEGYERATAIAAAIGYLRQYGKVRVEFSDGTVTEVQQRKAGLRE
jgi:hypothetical protein